MTPATNAPSALGAIVAAFQAVELEKILSGRTSDALVGREIYGDLRSHTYTLTRLRRNPSCRFDHETWAIRSVHVRTLGAAFGLAAPDGDRNSVRLQLHGDVFARTLVCRRCGVSHSTLKASRRLDSAERCCTECGGDRAVQSFDVQESLSIATVPDDVMDRPLAALGLLPNDVFSLVDDVGRATRYRLAGTRTSSSEAPVRTAAVIGCGNIGSHLVGHVGRSRLVERVILVDPDVYEPQNLDGQDIGAKDVGMSKVESQAMRLRAIRPEIQISAFRERFENVPLATFADSLIVSCVDSRGARRDINRAAWRLGTPWIDGAVGGIDLLARAAVYWPGPDRPCIECEWDDDDYRAIAVVETACRTARQERDQREVNAGPMKTIEAPDFDASAPDTENTK